MDVPGDEIPRVPGFGEIVGRVGIEQLMTIDARHGLGGNQQVMSAAFAVRQHGISGIAGAGVREVNALARRRGLVLRPVHDALFLHDPPQGVPAGADLRSIGR